MKLSQMQALKSQKGGFTLVELIVVITILAILATVGFLSYQGYTKDAKSAKVRENIGLITSKMGELGAGGADMTTLVSTGGEALDRTITLSGSKTVYGNSGATAATLKAGNVNWATVTGLSSSDMKDANDQYEPIVGIVSTSGHSAIQAASTIKVNEVDTIYVKGNFTPDSGSGAALGLIANSGATTELQDNVTGNHFSY